MSPGQDYKYIHPMWSGLQVHTSYVVRITSTYILCGQDYKYIHPMWSGLQVHTSYVVSIIYFSIILCHPTDYMIYSFLVGIEELVSVKISIKRCKHPSKSAGVLGLRVPPVRISQSRTQLVGAGGGGGGGGHSFWPGGGGVRRGARRVLPRKIK